MMGISTKAVPLAAIAVAAVAASPTLAADSLKCVICPHRLDRAKVESQP
jgi:hypothetical protein